MTPRRARGARTTRALALGVALLLAAAAPVLAHKEQLPKDALTLVRQAAMMLAKDPRLAGEAGERLEAALASRQTQGVSMDLVRKAQSALGAGRIVETRRLLSEALLPAPAPAPVKPRGASGPATATPAPAPPRPQTMEERMRMDETLSPRYGGTPGEIGVAAAGSALVLIGLAGRRRRAGVEP